MIREKSAPKYYLSSYGHTAESQGTLFEEGGEAPCHSFRGTIEKSNKSPRRTGTFARFEGRAMSNVGYQKDPPPRDGMSIMARILLLGPDESSAKVLALFLERRRHQVTVHRELQSAGDSPTRDLDNFDVLVVDMTANRPEDWNTLDRLRVETAAWNPGILCLSRVYRGPRFQLDIERRGARLVYVR